MVPKVRETATPREDVGEHTDEGFTAQLKDPKLLKQNAHFVNGEWAPAKSGKTFEVRGQPPRSSLCNPMSPPCS